MLRFCLEFVYDSRGEIGNCNKEALVLYFGLRVIS